MEYTETIYEREDLRLCARAVVERIGVFGVWHVMTGWMIAGDGPRSTLKHPFLHFAGTLSSSSSSSS